MSQARDRPIGQTGWFACSFVAVSELQLGDVFYAAGNVVLANAPARDGWLRRSLEHAASLALIGPEPLTRQVLAALALYCLVTGWLTSYARARAESLGMEAKGGLAWVDRMTEPESGSDAANIATSAMREGDEWVLVGEKSYISNGGIADFYVLFARTGEGPGAKGISAFILDSGTPGLDDSERIEVIAPHPLATLRFADMRLPASALLGEPGRGFAQAMATLDVFRTTVGAAALGFARRALDEATERARTRRLAGGALADNAIVQSMLADMVLDVEASALLVYRAAWLRDAKGARNSREAALAKLHATDGAQRVIDKAVQIFGGLGVTVGVPVERLYREIRALRIYEGASEVQKVVIARHHLAEHRA